jgi:hypothetical protein
MSNQQACCRFGDEVLGKRQVVVRLAVSSAALH